LGEGFKGAVFEGSLLSGQEIFRRNRNGESSAKATVYTLAAQCLVARKFYRIDRKNSSRVKENILHLMALSWSLVVPFLEIAKPSRKGRKSTPLRVH
jgi:hypothetical protein